MFDHYRLVTMATRDGAQHPAQGRRTEDEAWTAWWLWVISHYQKKEQDREKDLLIGRLKDPSIREAFRTAWQNARMETQ